MASVFNDLPLLKRCVVCPTNPPSCPACKSDEVCRQTVASCTSCASASCVKASLSGITSTSSTSTNKGPNVGAIVGGVIGGCIGISIMAFLIWKYILKGRRHHIEPEQEYFDEEDDIAPEKLQEPGSFIRMREAVSSRASTHTVGSLASTVLTRASNIIQIAYIPGVTNRSTMQSPGHLVPPVPPIPIPTTPSTLNSMYGPNGEEQRFFVPDLRDSQAFTDTSSLAGRSDVDAQSRKSIASSLARSTIYRDSAVVNPMPAQSIVMRKAAMVSVKSSNTTTPADTPAIGTPTPTIDLNRQTSAASGSPITRPVLIKVPASSDSIRPSPLGSQKSGKSLASTLAGARSMKPVALTISKKDSNKASSSGSGTVDSNDKAIAATEESTNSADTRDEDKRRHSSLNNLHRLSEVPSVTQGSDTPVTTAHTSQHMRALRESHADGSDAEQGSVDGDEHERSRQSLLGNEGDPKSPFEDDNAAETPTPRRTEFPKEQLDLKLD
jgi:protein OPY2